MRLDRPRLARPALPSKMRLRLAGQDRRPLLADDSGAHWQESDDVEDDVDAPGSPPGGSGKWKPSRSLTKSPRTPTLPAHSMKKVKRALGASLPSRRGNDRAKSLKDLYDDDDLESRDDESRCLLAGAYDEYYYLDRQGRTNFFAGEPGDELSQESFGAPVVREPSEEEVRQLQLTPRAYRESPGVSSLSSFKQLNREESGALNVVDLGGFDSSSVGSASDKENAVAGGKDVAVSPKAPSRLSSLASDLAGLQISQRSSLLTGSAHNSSVLGYSVDNSSSKASGSPLGTPTSQQWKTPEQKDQTPVESLATGATYATSYTQPRKSPCPVAVTATNHGDVILMTPLEDVIDAGPQPEKSEASSPGISGSKQALMLPSLSPGTVQDGKAALEPALKNAGKETPVKEAKREGFCPQESPTGVDEVFSSEDEFSQVNFASKPPSSTTKEASEFIASEDWSGSEGDAYESLGGSSQAFGSVTVHQDAFRDLATERAQRSTIEMRPSLESDREASSSTVAEKSPAESVNRSLLDVALLEEPEEPEEEPKEENKEERKETCVRLGSFSQIYSREGNEELLEEDSDDSESGCYFDLGHDDIDDAAAPASPRGNVHRSSVSQKSRPWAQVEGADDDMSADCVETDLVSLDGSEDDLPLTPNHLLSSETSDSPASTGGSTDESPTPAMDDFDKLNGYWMKEWSAAIAEPETETTEEDEHQPRFLLKKDVGNAMDDEDEPEEDAEENICKDCDGNQYLKIYDLDRDMDIYEVLQKSTELETVEECSSEEEEEITVDAKEEEKEDEDTQPLSKDLNDLWSKIDAYQSTVGRESTKPSFRCVKSSSKKRGVRVTKRAIVKSKSSSKAKFDLAALEKGSHHEEGTHQEKRSHSRTGSSSLDGIVAEALGLLVRRESGIAEPDEEESATARRTSMNNTELSLLRLMKTEDLKLLNGSDGEGSEASSSLSLDSSGDEDSWNMEEDDEEKGKSGPSEQPVVATEPASQRPVVQRGASFTLTKLYSENVELAETLATTQSELEKVQRQLELVISERDDVVASARFEM